MQLILECKKGLDEGTVSYRDATSMGSSWGCDRRTAVKVLTVLRQKGLVETDVFVQKCDKFATSLRQVCDNNATKMSPNNYKRTKNVIVIKLPNYKKWQEISVKDVSLKKHKNVAKMSPIRAEQTRIDKEKKEKRKPNPAHVNTPEELVDLYHLRCPSLHKISVLTAARRVKYKTAINRKKNKDYWVGLFNKAENATFLGGDNDRGWKANLDWLLKPANAVKVLEGYYIRDERRATTPKTMTIDELEKIINK